MSFILTLVSSDKKLSAGHLAGIERSLDYHSIELTGTPVWLKPHKAADIPVSGKPDAAHMAEMREALAADRIDIFVSPAAGRRKMLLIADMDATIVTGETLDALAAQAGIGDKVAALTARAMNGELDFAAALTERVAMLAGLESQILQEVLDSTVLSQGADILVRVMASRGATCVLVSGGFTFFTGAIAERAGFHHHHGNVLDVQGGKLTGTVAEPILDKDAKRGFLQHYVETLGLRRDDTLAIGDGANDLPMLAAAGLGLGYRPKPVLRDALDNCILYGDLTAALYVQGYQDFQE